MSEAFPRRPAPRHSPPTPEEIAAACEDFALHIPSLFTKACIADGCDEESPCHPRRRATNVLDRAGLIDVDGRLRM